MNCSGVVLAGVSVEVGSKVLVSVGVIVLVLNGVGIGVIVTSEVSKVAIIGFVAVIGFIAASFGVGVALEKTVSSVTERIVSIGEVTSMCASLVSVCKKEISCEFRGFILLVPMLTPIKKANIIINEGIAMITGVENGGR